MSPIIINDSFKKNFNAFVNTYRIQTARERLIDVDHYGNLTIKGIAESVGFKSPTTFINVFKKMVGLSPSVYQNMAKKTWRHSPPHPKTLDFNAFCSKFMNLEQNVFAICPYRRTFAP